MDAALTFTAPRGSKKAIGEDLLPWFGKNARDLPWRRDRSPYAVWVSECMLQQTRVDTVIPYFLRWMERFPSIDALAAADPSQVLKAWEGLGYYSRARNLHQAAKELRQAGGQLPTTSDALLSVRGIGPYKAAAIGSLAFGESIPVLDGNVERVLSRLCAISQPISPAVKEAMKSLLARLIQGHPPGAFNEAMMELGATICTPRNPSCDVCPLSTCCRVRKTGQDPHLFPVKTPKKKIPTVHVGAAVTRRGEDDCWLIAQRLPDGMLAGLWEFPGGKLEEGETMEGCIRRELMEELGLEVQVGEKILVVKHTYSHFHLRLHVHWADWQDGKPQCLDCADWAWVHPTQLSTYAFGRADLKAIEFMRQKYPEVFR